MLSCKLGNVRVISPILCIFNCLSELRDVRVISLVVCSSVFLTTWNVRVIAIVVCVLMVMLGQLEVFESFIDCVLIISRFIIGLF